MTIDRNDCGERQAQLDWMIDEFRQARSRRLVKVPDKVLESRVETAGSATAEKPVVDGRPVTDGRTR